MSENDGRLRCANGNFNIYRLDPSLVAAGIFSVLFLLLACGHIFRTIRSKQWFMITMIVGTIFEIAGFAVRVTGHSDPCTLGPYVIQYLLILLAPSIFSATVYMILGRTVKAVHGEALSPIRPTWLTKIFVTGDVVCFLIQCFGGGLLASSDGDKKKADLGKIVILGSLVLQSILFGIFLTVTFIFKKRLTRQPTAIAKRPEMQWLTMIHVLYGVSFLILLRNLFRVIEYASGEDGYLLTHEWPMYVFDATLMLAVVAVLLWWFPTLIRPQNSYMMDSLEGQTPLTSGGNGQYKNIPDRSPSPLPYRPGHQ